ncbi:MAG TPA: GNAT family N-acetyltransferase [Alphaproteobacteria bacterium]|nr:GNAT family N-acetyltransferase [Alphaproteobacteria bacterium]HAJ45852.1 GNAT family N-acetyltransferase [Alphaproteobacteria bacterium]
MPIIRAAVPADAEHIGRVHVQVWRETYPGIVPQTILDTMSVEARAARWHDVLSNQPADQFFHLVLDGSELIGFCGGGPARYPTLGLPGEIYMINIVKAAHRKGVGRALMHRAAQSLMASGHTCAGLWVFVENHNARAFYRRLGGVETDIRHTVEFNGDPRPEMAVHWGNLSTLAANSR